MDSYPHTGPDGQRSALARCRSCIFFADPEPDPAAPGRPRSGRCHAAPPVRDTSGGTVSRLALRVAQAVGIWLMLAAMLNRTIGLWSNSWLSIAGWIAAFLGGSVVFVWLREQDRKRARPAGIFPMVSADQWCGHWSMRPAVSESADDAVGPGRFKRAG
jgi:hypothetical protein